MSSITLKEKVCALYRIEHPHFDAFMLQHTLFRRVRLVRPLVQIFYPDFLFNEKRLVEKVAKAVTLREVQSEIDFYQHKYVVNSFLKDALRFRLSGMRMMSIATKAFNHNQRPLKSSGAPVT